MRAPEGPSSRVRGYLLALLAAACWASGGLIAKWLFSAPSEATASWPLPPLGLQIAPATLSGARALSSSLILVAFLAVRRPQALRTRPQTIPFLALFGVVGMAGVHFTYFKTISLTSVATAILLQYLAPILVMVVSVLFLGHRFMWTLPVGVALSVGGCALVVGALGDTGLVVSTAGIAWGLAAAVCFAAYSLMGSWATGRVSPETTLAFGLAFAAAFWAIVLGPAEIVRPFTDWRLAGAITYMAVFSTVIPFSAFLVALEHIPPTNATVTSTIEPVLAGLGAFALFGESFGLLQLVGGLLVIAAIAVVQLPDPDPLPLLPPQD